jgi:hypothetical protein
MEKVFTDIYESGLWGTNHHPAYSGNSGRGSDVDFNKDTYVPFLKNFIISNNIKSVVDMGCGDFRTGKLIYDELDVTYTGYDAYKKVVDYHATQYPSPKYSFEHVDIFNDRDNIVGGDLCILKDVLQHWKMDEIYSFLDYLIERGAFKYILICNCCNQTEDNPANDGRSIPLSADFLPLKRYNPVKLYKYNTKEVSVITSVSHTQPKS